jgi:hypothetical protein
LANIRALRNRRFCSFIEEMTGHVWDKDVSEMLAACGIKMPNDCSHDDAMDTPVQVELLGKLFNEARASHHDPEQQIDSMDDEELGILLDSLGLGTKDKVRVTKAYKEIHGFAKLLRTIVEEHETNEGRADKLLSTLDSFIDDL